MGIERGEVRGREKKGGGINRSEGEREKRGRHK